MHAAGIFWDLVLASLAIWRLNQLFNRRHIVPVSVKVSPSTTEAEQLDSKAKLREALYRWSLWIAAPAAILLNNGFSGLVIHWFTITGAALLLDSAHENPSPNGQNACSAEGDIS